MVSVNDNHYRRDLSHISRDLFTIMMPALIVAQKLELIAGDPATPIAYSCSVSPLTNSVFDRCELLMRHTAYPDSMSQIEGLYVS